MSHWKGYETQDTFCNETDRVDHFHSIQDGQEALESVTFNDSHKELRFEGANDGRTSVCHEDSVTETALRKLDAIFFPSSQIEGSSNILDPSLSLIAEKDASALGNIKCSTEGTNLDCKGDKKYTKSVIECENDTQNNTLHSDYGNTGDMHNKTIGVSRVDSFVGILTMAQISGEDLLFSDYPNIGHFEDFEKMFRNNGSNFAHGSTVTEDEISWFSSSSHGFHGAEDTLQSVVLSSVSTSSAFNNASSAHDMRSNDLPATEPLAISTEFPSTTDCISLPLYSDTERKGKTLLSELAYDLTGVEKSMTLEQIGYGNSRRNPIIINTTLKELSTSKGKKSNPTYGATAQSSLSGCSLVQCHQDQELLSSFLPVPSLCSRHAISKKILVSESLASNCLHSYDPQAQLSDILKSSIIKSSDCPDYVTPINPSSDANHSMGLLPGPFPMLLMPTEKNEEMYSCLHFPAAWIMDKPLEQHMDNAPEHHVEASNSSDQRKYKIEGDKEPAVTKASSTLQDNSCLTSTCIDDVSIKAASFQQLQMIMDRLGIRTRLCIRDSLYRLARSAEQSHCYGSASNVSAATCPMRGFQSSKDSMRPPEFLGLSMSTNEIERAVAYLLFHKSLGSGTGSADDSMWLRTPLHILDSVSKHQEPYQPAS